MTTRGAPLEAVSRHGRAVLSHPRHDSAWIVVLAATLRDPATGLEARVDRLARAVPMVAARLAGREWRQSQAPVVEHASGDGVAVSVAEPFNLADEAPLRVIVDPDGHRLVLAGHHAAFDGLALVHVLRALVGGPLPQRAHSDPPAPSAGLSGLLDRFLHPADPVASARRSAPAEVCLARTLRVEGPDISARIAAAATAALGAHNARHGARWRRVGISIGISGPEGVGNVATYRRIDTSPDSDIRAVVNRAIATDPEPIELRRNPRLAVLARPALARFGDSFLVSNLGRQELGPVDSLEFYPVARGRSAVAFGAAGLTGGPSALTLRTLRVHRDDAELILDETVKRLGSA